MAEFKLPPISTLAGTTLQNYFKVIKGNKISSKFYFKHAITQLIILIATPFHIYENLKYKSKIQNFEFQRPPIFVLGHWRSGTTHLHNLLCQATDAAYITTYNSLFPNNLGSKAVFKNFMKWNMPEKRPSDNVRLNIDFPQEDEFAIGNLCPHSYYNFFYFPNSYREFYRDFIRFENVDPTILENWKRNYKKLLIKAKINTGGRNLIVKNPVNTGRYDKIMEIFPEAKFIHIYRNPYIVYLSTKKFFMELLPTLWFQEVGEEFVEKVVIEIYEKVYQDYFEKIALFNENNFYEVSFEEFEEDPLTYIHEMYQKLDLGNYADQEKVFLKYLSQNKGYKKNKYNITRRELNLINENWSTYIQKWNYSIPKEIVVN